MMKKGISVFLIAVLVAAALGPLAPRARADEPKTLEHKFRHHSPLPATIMLLPLGLAAFTIDVPIYMVSRQQPMTYALTKVELIDGYNPMTGGRSCEEKPAEHVAEASGTY
ncbi:MAG: hypothetical protein A2Y95_04950 [Deltaproteobacteria bacterium RBG_13_65_10]|nr:MAG: hypothetical protein A2Y95_04950 [Deltaproteobacteria bacterium RBG_13_65_10]